MAAGLHTNRLSGIVTDSAFLGHAYRHTLKVGDLTLQCTGATQTRFAAGCEVAVDFAYGQACGLVHDSHRVGTQGVGA